MTARLPANPQPDQLPHQIEFEGWRVAWKGFLYVPGCRGGEASARALVERMRRLGVGEGSCAARGTYWLCVQEPGGVTHHMVDPCGLMRVFVASGVLYEHYRDALVAQGLTLEAFDPDAIIEFLNYGRFGAHFSHSSAVRALSGAERFEVSCEGVGRVCARPLPELGAHEGVSLAQAMEELAEALHGRRVAVDLTGGLDSRLLVAALSAGEVPFVTGLSGAEHYTEFAQAEAVAVRLDRPFVRYGHHLDTLDDDLRRHSELSQGLIDVVATHRARCMQEARVRDGVEVAVGGMGGEMINDFTFLQDVPFLWRQRADLERFWRLRLLSLTLPEALLAPRLRAHQRELAERMLSRLDGYRRSSAVATYLHVFYAHRMSAAAGAQLTAGAGEGLGELAPLMDYDLYCGTVDLPLRQRIASAHHRGYIKAHAPQLAGLPSSTGMSLPIGLFGEVRDWVGFSRMFAYRAARKVEQKVRRRRLRQESPDHPEFIPAVRRTEAARAALSRLQRAEILAPELTLETLPNAWLGKVVSLGLLAEQLDEAS